MKHVVLDLVLAGMLAGATSATAAIIGSGTIDRGYLDSYTQFQLVDTAAADTVASSGTLTSWSFYAGQPGTLGLEVFRPVIGGYQLVAETDYTAASVGVQTIAVSIPVQAGDLMGIWTGANSVIPFDYTSGGNHIFAYTSDNLPANHILVGGTLLASSIEGLTDRLYSLQATVTPVPEPTTVLAGAGALGLVLASFRLRRSTNAR